jgi:8-oxo-dGTP pyrophosphatase MutT (NUDIX family)
LEINTLKIKSSGALFLSRNTKRVLLLQKAAGKKEGVWGLVGGKIHPNESVWQGLQREVIEEIGFMPETIKSIPLEMFVSDDNHFNFQTYICIVNDEFVPVLSSEHMGWSWCFIDKWPRPIHQGIKNTVSSKIVRAKLDTIFEMMDLIRVES